MTGLRIGSLFSGAGGLDRAVQAVFSGTVAWQCEVDPAASKVLAARWANVPNLGDITRLDWDYLNLCVLPRIDILCAGWPCQPWSAAGRRKGTSDDRALWPYVAAAVGVLRPRIVVLENVPGIVVLGELARAVGDLCALGYDAQWATVAAADIGAPHRRDRVFIIATDTNAERRHGRRHTNGLVVGGHNEIDWRRGQQSAAGCDRAADADSSCDGRDEGWPEPARLVRGSDAAVSGDGPVELLPTPRATRGGSSTETVELLPTPSVADNEGGHLNRSGARSDELLLLPGVARAYENGELLPTPLARDSRHAAPGDYLRHTPSLAAVDFYLPTPTASDCTGGGQDPDRRTGHTHQLIDEVLTTQWGKYEPAIRRWEQLTRPAPSPTEPNTKGNPRLSAAFSEWMMGWPAGWVTQVPGISRNDALRIIGNGVVPQQAIAALQWLISIAEVSA